MVQVILEDDGGGDGVELAALAEAASVAALTANNCLGLLGRESFVPQRHGHTDHPSRYAGEVPRAPRLRTH